MNHPLAGVREKVIQAEAHLATVKAQIQSHKEKCIIVAKRRPNAESLFDLYANFPSPDLSMGCVVSDCLHNLRTALNYLVHELAVKNGKPAVHNLFPICNTSKTFQRQVEDRHRLHNVPEEARAMIESLQPYNAKGGKRFSHPLYILNKLANAEKYQLLSLTVVCRPRPVFVVEEPNGPTEIEGTFILEAVQDGAYVAEQHLPGFQADEVVMHIRRGLYLPFKNLPWADSAVDTVLGKIVWFVKDQVVPRFEPFFDHNSQGLAYSARTV